MSIKRIELDGSNEERGGQQFVSGRGLFKDAYTGVHRVEPHGFMSMPVKGAKALLLSPPHDPDQAYVVGGEHPSHRPKDIPGGGTAIYDAGGNIISLVGTKIRLVAPLFEFVGNFQLQGDMEVTGNIHATGSIIDDGGNTANHSH